MHRIDTEKWGEFKVKTIFPDIKKPKVYHTREVIENEGGIPYVVRSKYNNGIKYRVEKPDEVVNPSNVISFGSENATFFYQQEEWVSGRDIYYIDTRNLSKYTCLFITACLQPIATKYSYNFGLFPDLLKEENIKLPISSEGQPDWSYMEDYMIRIEKDVKPSLNNFIKAKKSSYKRIDTSKWGIFVIEKLFDKIDLKIKKEGFSKIFDVSLEKNEEFSLPLINAKDGNNGIMYYGRPEDFESEKMCLDIVKNGAIATGNVYAQPQRTSILWDAYLIKPKQAISEYSLLYLSRIVQTVIKQKYSYDDKAIWAKVKLETIKLPVDEKGKPDWDYMEGYMKSIEKKMKVHMKAIV